jgi:hypothetical protein
MSMHALCQYSEAMQEGSPRHSSKAERCLQRELEQRPRQMAVAELSAAASSFLAFLRMQLQGQVTGWFQQDLQELWEDVVMHKPPWDNLQFVEVLEHHYNSSMKVCSGHAYVGIRMQASNCYAALRATCTIGQDAEMLQLTHWHSVQAEWVPATLIYQRWV